MKGFFILFAVLLCIFSFAGCSDRNVPASVDLSGKQILMIIAPKDFRDEELIIPKNYFEKMHANVIVASTTLESVKGMMGGSAKADIILKDVDVNKFDAVVFVGGMGSMTYFNDPVALDIAKKAAEKNKVLAAICLATSILANADILRGKNATVFESEGKNLKEKGANYVGDKNVVRDGRIITGNGPEAAQEFAETISQALAGK